VPAGDGSHQRHGAIFVSPSREAEAVGFIERLIATALRDEQKRA
jgi:hypothetical protein